MNNITAGTWELKGAATYYGEFKMGKPYGTGKFAFESGLQQTGSFVEQKNSSEEEEDTAEGDGPKAPNVSWQGASIVTM